MRPNLWVVYRTKRGTDARELRFFRLNQAGTKQTSGHALRIVFDFYKCTKLNESDMRVVYFIYFLLLKGYYNVST